MGCNDSDSNHDIEVYISTGELQCQDNGLDISVTKSYLLDVKVKSESCGSLTEVDFIQECGGGTGNLHVFTIDESDMQVAEDIGFTIPDSADPDDDYEKVECSA